MVENWKNGRKRPRGAWLLVALLAIAILGYQGWRELRGHASTGGAGMGTAAAQRVPVTYADVGEADYPVYVRGIGTVSAFKTVTVKSRVDGAITKVLFRQGQIVREGDPLVEIDRRPYQAAFDQAVAKKAQDQANLKNNQLILERYQSLAAKDFQSRENLDTQQAQVEQLRAQIQGDQAAIDSAKVNLDYTTISSPITGRVGFRLIDPGNIVHAADSTGIVTIAQLQPIAVEFTAPQDRLQAIAKAFDGGQVPVDAISSDGRRTLARGQLVAINNTVDLASGTIGLKARFDNQDNALWPGLSVDTRMRIDTLKRVVLIPMNGVMHGPDGLFAYVIGDDGKVSARPIQLGASDDERAVVVSGLGVGQRVVVAGQSRLQEGTLVDARPMRPETQAPTASNASAEISPASAKKAD